MNTDDELDAWRAQWRHNDSIPVGLQARVTRETRSMKIGLAAECLVTLAYLGVSIKWLLEGSDEARVLAILIWVVTATALGFSVLNQWGAWKPATSTTRAFLEISVLRLHRRRQALSFAVVLYAVMLGFMLRFAWLRASAGATPPESVWTFLTTPFLLVWWFVTAVFLSAVAWRLQRTRAQLTHLTAVRAQFLAGDVTGQSAD